MVKAQWQKRFLIGDFVFEFFSEKGFLCSIRAKDICVNGRKEYASTRCISVAVMGDAGDYRYYLM